jgi:hypothetical protein
LNEKRFLYGIQKMPAMLFPQVPKIGQLKRRVRAKRRGDPALTGGRRSNVLEVCSDSAQGASPATQRAAFGACHLLDKELVRAHRVASDSLEPDDIRWLCKGFSAFLASGGKLPLERCLRLPTNERALQRAQRDHWLRVAWQQLDPAASSWRRSELLANEVHRFQVKWARWSQLTEPPAGARAVDQALFEAFRAHKRVPSTAMQLHNIASARRRD